MALIAPRQAEVLSYLTGRARVGEWFHAARTQIAGDTGMSEYAVCQHLQALIRKGCIERDEMGLLRVIRRLEDSGVRQWRIRPEKPATSPKVRYPGYDSRAVARWESVHLTGAR